MNYLVRNMRNGTPSILGDFDRYFARLFDDTPSLGSRVPAVDVQELDDRYVLEADLPGMTQKEIDVKVEDNLLTISSEKKAETEQKPEGYIVRERRASSFRRSFVLPKDVDHDKIEAHFRNGILRLELHKSPEAKPRAIEVKAE
ncbi:MAG TPA: Hsp20/alpha crystallin family protein [Spirochaetia bacterium]|nr:Hsp20/alpha crystallin family protein [Spirochaetia bacterium]